MTYTKQFCRDYINEKRRFINVKAICDVLGLKSPHMSQFLKGSEYDMFMSLENAIKFVEFLENL